MPAIVINGTTFNGTLASGNMPPSEIDYEITKAGEALVMASGLRVFVGPGTVRGKWTLKWAIVNPTTRNTVRATAGLANTFVYVDEEGEDWTVQAEGDAYQHRPAVTTSANVVLYELTLVLYQAN